MGQRYCHSRLVQVVSKRLLSLMLITKIATGVLAHCSDILPQCNFLGWRLELNTLYCRDWTESVLEAGSLIRGIKPYSLRHQQLHHQKF
jgi:hypothetical protein